MNETIKNSLNETFGIQSTQKVISPSVSTKTVVSPVVPSVQKQKTTTIARKVNSEALKEQNEKERREDLKTSRTAIEKVLQTGTDAIDNLYSLAIDSEEPRTYEVLADMIDKIGNAAEKLMKLRREEAEIAKIEAKIESDKNTEQETGPKSVTNNNIIFAGDSKELLKHIKQATTKVIENAVEEVK